MTFNVRSTGGCWSPFTSAGRGPAEFCFRHRFGICGELDCDRESRFSLLTRTGVFRNWLLPTAATIGVLGNDITSTHNRAWAPSRCPAIEQRHLCLQVQRMGNPLINELIIGTGYKDRLTNT